MGVGKLLCKACEGILRFVHGLGANHQSPSYPVWLLRMQIRGYPWMSFGRNLQISL